MLCVAVPESELPISQRAKDIIAREARKGKTTGEIHALLDEKLVGCGNTPTESVSDVPTYSDVSEYVHDVRGRARELLCPFLLRVHDAGPKSLFVEKQIYCVFSKQSIDLVIRLLLVCFCMLRWRWTAIEEHEEAGGRHHERYWRNLGIPRAPPRFLLSPAPVISLLFFSINILYFGVSHLLDLSMAYPPPQLFIINSCACTVRSSFSQHQPCVPLPHPRLFLCCADATGFYYYCCVNMVTGAQEGTPGFVWMMVFATLPMLSEMTRLLVSVCFQSCVPACMPPTKRFTNPFNVSTGQWMRYRRKVVHQ